MLLSTADQARAVELARMKRLALSLLVAAAVVFIIFRRLEADSEWAGYVRAMAEAAMVGALADWFAVTALFRHPLRIPIPHTAIIPTRKEALGKSLGEFVHGNFLTGEMVAEKVAEADPASRIAEWLREEPNRHRVSTQLMSTLTAGLEFVDDDRAGPAVERFLRKRLDTIDAGNTIATFIDALMDGGHQQVLYDATINGASTFLVENQQMLRRRLEHESPWYVPEFLDDRVFDKLFGGVTSYLDEIKDNPRHELRIAVDDKSREMAERLRSDPALRGRAADLKQQLLDHPEFTAWSHSLWTNLRTELDTAVGDPTSALHARARGAVSELAERIDSDADLRGRINAWAVDVARFVTEQGGGEIGTLIANTVDHWDPTEASTRIELAVGRDLQYIRINGTIVGGLAGLVIHGVGKLIA
jgi:uncharacterized membrane-anchored protein YjiN (DUF445 family)